MSESMHNMLQKTKPGMMRSEEMPRMMEAMMGNMFKEMTPQDRTDFIQ